MVVDQQEPFSSQAWMAEFRRRVAQTRVPLSAMLELTSRCNLRCVHCYLGSQEEQHKKRDFEMGTDEVKQVINDLADAGCLYLTITGGDPMMRRDFSDIYRHACERGMLVSVFCDGILVTDRILALFEELPPRKVEISIYGATAETYETVTRVPGSYQHALRGIHRLIDAGVRVSLKTVLMTLNRHELDAMKAIADDLGVAFKFDGAIFPCLPNSDHGPVQFRVEAKEVVDREMSDPERRRCWAESYDRAQEQPESDRLFTCGAGASSVYLDPFGKVSPCLMSTQFSFDLKEKPFSEIWDEDMVKMRSLKRPSPGVAPELRGTCSDCPGVNYLETGKADVESAYTQALRQHRLSAIMAEKEKRSSDGAE